MNRVALYGTAASLLAFFAAGNATAQLVVSDPVPIDNPSSSQTPLPTGNTAPAAASNPVPTGTAPAQKPTHTENFDTDPVTGWRYSCQHRLVPIAGGRALETSGGGHAIWRATDRLKDFTLSFRFRYEQGVGDVFFRATETSAGMEFYCLNLGPNAVELARRLHAPGQEVPQRVLASAPRSLQPQGWYDVTIRATGGLIEVWIGDQQAIRYLDPQPLTAGPCGLGVTAGSGTVLYDDVALTAGDVSDENPAPRSAGQEGRRASSDRQ